MFVPLISFFACQSIFNSPLVSGGVAAAAANIVLIAYIIVAFREDTPEEAVVESKKDQ